MNLTIRKTLPLLFLTLSFLLIFHLNKVNRLYRSHYGKGNYIPSKKNPYYHILFFLCLFIVCLLAVLYDYDAISYVISSFSVGYSMLYLFGIAFVGAKI
jgi:hypothetical protein